MCSTRPDISVFRPIFVWRLSLLLAQSMLAQPTVAAEPIATAKPAATSSVQNSSAAHPPATQASSTVPAPAGDTGMSAWLNSFPPQQRRLLGTGADQRAVLLWSPQQRWRGEVILVPGIGNAVHRQSPLLALAERLAHTGWRCWVMARETHSIDTEAVAPPSLPRAEELSALLSLLAGEAAPADAAPVQTGRLPIFLIAQADATQLAWSEAATEKRFNGVVILAAEQFPDSLQDQAPKLPVLELQIAEQARAVPAAASARQQRWQHLPQYQQQTLQSSARIPALPWLSNTIDGWLRKIAAQAGARP